MSVNWLKDFTESLPLTARLRYEGSDLSREAADEIDKLINQILELEEKLNEQ